MSHATITCRGCRREVVPQVLRSLGYDNRPTDRVQHVCPLCGHSWWSGGVGCGSILALASLLMMPFLFASFCEGYREAERPAASRPTPAPTPAREADAGTASPPPVDSSALARGAAESSESAESPPEERSAEGSEAALPEGSEPTEDDEGPLEDEGAKDGPRAETAPAETAPEPKALKRVEPEYPEVARRHNIRGTVTVELRVGPDGRVISAEAVDGPRLLAGAAERAARSWVFDARSAPERWTQVRFVFK